MNQFARSGSCAQLMKTYPDSSFNKGWRQIWPTSPRFGPLLGEVAPPTSPPASFPTSAWPALDRKETSSVSPCLHEPLLHLGSPWGFSVDVWLSLTSFYEGNETPAPSGVAAGALGRPFGALLFLQSVTCCLQLGVVHYNLTKVFSR